MPSLGTLKATDRKSQAKNKDKVFLIATDWNIQLHGYTSTPLSLMTFLKLQEARSTTPRTDVNLWVFMLASASLARFPGISRVGEIPGS